MGAFFSNRSFDPEPPPATPDFQDAFDAHQRGDYRSAYKIYLPLAAKQGNIDAQFALGWIYLKDERYETSYQEAVKWYQFEAENGYVEAQYKIGIM